ncbi:MAG: outer membrane beta-barrel protein, partial [Gemmatimonadetes bacterium]|nr:outer membrane beta-barrel protein [Gemmatimonadota bacterium]
MLSIRYRLHRLLFLAVVVPIAALATAHGAEGQGLTFTASPSARWIQWDDDLGFDDSRLLGGAVGLGFGRYVGLEAFHHQDDDVALFSGDASPFSADVAVSGARVTLALGTGRLVPVVGGGASILRLRPDGVEATKKLAFDYGVGFRAVLAERIQGEVTVEQSQYRLDPGGLVDPDLAETGPTRRNLMLRAGLGIQLGRRSFDRASALDDSFAQRYQAPFTGFALAIEPLVGRLDFDSATGLAKQDMVGIRAGVDFGSFFGLRAFHWWGTESDFRTTNGMRALGGEAQFNLSGGPGLTPYLAGGAARLTWSDRGNGVQPPPSDQTAAVIGGGVDFNFGPRVRLTVAARDYILAGSDLAASPDLGAVADPDELIHNWQFSGGLKLVLGGGGGLRSGDPEDLQPIEVDATEPLADTIPVPAPQVAPAPEVVDSVSRATAAPTTTTAPEPTAARIDSSRVIVLPVPEVGELYVRFGEAAPARGLTRLLDAPLPDSSVAPAAIDADRLRAIIREELESLRPDSTEAAPPAEDPRVQALEAKIDSLARLVRELAEVRRTPEPAPVTEAVTPAYQQPVAPA